MGAVVLVLLSGCGARSGLLEDDRDGGLDPGDCVDADGDGVADRDEAPGDTDGDGTADVDDRDDDGDGIETSVEAGDDDPCTPPDESDCDGSADTIDLDSDADGVLDADERTAHTDATRPDTDGDGLPDGAELLYGSSPTEVASTLSEGDFFFSLPHGVAENGRFTVRQVESADVLFVVDTTGSMSGAIVALQNGLSDTILPGLQARIPDLQVGVAEFEDFAWKGFGDVCSSYYGAPLRGKDHAFNLLQQVTDVTGWVETALSDLDRPMGCGGDGPEAYVEALYQTATGEGIERTDGGEPFAGSVTCEEVGRVGGGCFRIGSLPIILLVGDNEFHNGPPDGTFSPYGDIPVASPQPHTWPEAIDALGVLGARVIGLVNEDSAFSMADEHMAQTASATGAVDPGGAPLVFTYEADGTGLDQTVVDAVRALVREEPHDLSTRTEDTVEDGIDASQFVVDVSTVGATPPTGIGGMDAHTFQDVLPGTEVEFEIEAANDFVDAEPSARDFMAIVVVLADGAPRFGGHHVLVEVPPECPRR